MGRYVYNHGLRVIIIGGGIGGLTAAIALGKLGIGAQVFEQAPELQEVGAGIGLLANAIRVLDVLGLAGAIRSQSADGVQGGLRSPDGSVLVAVPSEEITGNGSAAVLHRAELQMLLARHLDSDRLHTGFLFTGFEESAGGITVRFQNGETARGDVLVGADGLRSRVRGQLFGNPPIRYAGYTAWRSIVEFDGGHPLMMAETWGRGRRFGIVPMGGRRVYWFATSNAPEGERDPEGGAKELLLKLFQGWHRPVEALIAAADEEAILRNDIYDMNPLPALVSGCVALLGDAAHAMTPNLGQGACQAIEDAVVLGVCLRNGRSAESGLLEYDRRRRPRTRRFVLASRRLGEIAQIKDSFACRMRDAILRATPRRLALRQMNSMLNVEILTASERALFDGRAGS